MLPHSCGVRRQRNKKPFQERDARVGFLPEENKSYDKLQINKTLMDYL
jgi:ABC-type uncharacterized transport system ATPase subunit